MKIVGKKNIGLPKCRICGVDLSACNWQPAFMKRGSRRCRQCSNAIARKYNAEHKERHKEIKREHYHRNAERLKAAAKTWRLKGRKQVLSHYGGKCACCGESRYEFLAFDHINGGGKQHIEEIQRSDGHRLLWVWLKQNNFPLGFRVLCHNCNMSIGMHKYCPHQQVLVAGMEHPEWAQSC